MAQGGELCEVLSLPLPPKASRAASMGCAQHLSRRWCQSADRNIDRAVPAANSVTSPTFNPSPRPLSVGLLCLSNNASCHPPPPSLYHLSPGPSTHHLTVLPPDLPSFHMTNTVFCSKMQTPSRYSAASKPSLPHRCLWNRGYLIKIQ